MKKYYSQFKKIVVAILIGVGFYFLSTLFFIAQQSALIGGIAFLVTLWTNEGLHLGVVSLIPVILFPALGILTTKATAVNYANPIIFLFYGGFLLSIAVEKSRLHIYIADKILNLFPATPRGMILSLAITSGLLSSILSNTTTTLLLIAIALFITDNARLKMRLALAIAYGANIGGIMTPIGTPPNLILLGILSDHSEAMIPFVQWMWMVMPLAFVMLISMSLLLSIGTKDIVIERRIEQEPLSWQQKKVLFVLLSLIVVLLVNAPIKPYWGGLGLSESGLLLGFGLLLFLPPFSILEWDLDNKKIPYAIILLFGAGFSIAKAFGVTGLANEMASYLQSMTHLPPILLLISVAFMITFMTELTSNTALTSIMLPVIYAVSQNAGLNMTLFMMVATIAASYAFMLPIATAPNAIAMSSGVIHIKDMLRYGFILNLLGIFFVVLIAHFFWKSII